MYKGALKGTGEGWARKTSDKISGRVDDGPTLKQRAARAAWDAKMARMAAEQRRRFELERVADRMLAQAPGILQNETMRRQRRRQRQRSDRG